MSIRTIEAPGVEIKEIDKSGYTPAMTGTRCFVMGYSDKGEPYQPMQFTSKSAWQNYYGDPDDEAERYFYNACAEVINQNGVLYSARIPYDNAARDKMVGFKYKVGLNPKHSPSVGEYLTESPVAAWVDHDDDFEKDALEYAINNKCYREIDAVLSNGMEEDKEIKEFYGYVFTKFKQTYDSMLKYKRYSIQYYTINLSASQSLSARFHTKQEAYEYLLDYENQSRPGRYKCIVRQRDEFGKEVKRNPEDPMEGYNILSDAGDWIAQPLCCDFVKEATAKIAVDAPKIDINTVNELKIEVENNLCSVVKDAGKQWTLINTINDISVNLQTVKEIYENGKGTEKDKTYVNDLINYLSDFTGSFEQEKGKEFGRYGYSKIRMDELLSSVSSINLLDLYDLGQLCGNILCGSQNITTGNVLNIYANYDIELCCDGADNEWLFDQDVSVLWQDPVMKLNDPQAGAISKQANKLYNNELWHPYKGRSLKKILREKQYENFENFNQMRAFDDSYELSSFDAIRNIFKREGGIKFKDIIEKYGVTQERIHDDVPFYQILDLDEQMNDFLEINPSVLPIMTDLTAVDEYRTGENTVPANTFWVFDKTCGTLNKIPEDDRKNEKRQLIGIFPVITTAANALYAQNLIEVADSDVVDYETVNGIVTKSFNETGKIEDTFSFRISSDVATKFSQEDKTGDDTGVIDTISRQANEYFLPIQMNPQLTGIDKENAKKIGVVVVKAYLDASEGNKVSFNIVESFCGSLDKNAKNPNTGVSTFIDKIINTQSDYIYFFSNCFVSTAAKNNYNNVVDYFVCNRGKSGMLGFFENETIEEISLTSIYNGIDKCFKNVEDINERDIDIVCDAGLANIAQYMKSVYGGGPTPHAYDLNATDDNGNPLIKTWKCASLGDVGAWKTVLFKYDNFCKNVRKDCMFIADGPRPLVLQGEKKIVRSSKPSNTIDANILPNVKWMTGLNTNYGAGYCDWFQITDEFTGDEFWCPPSIKAMGVYVYTDLNFEYWDAPAGLNRGVVQALDCAFSPTVKQAGPIYQKNWNYAINYPNDGIVLEGQKTFQVKPSAFDRVNVRRLFLRLERQTYKVARYFVYEGNTAYTRQRLVDMLDPIFYQAKVGGGVYDYKIICDESINTPNVIDNNELRVKIGIQPVKTAEFILIDFIALSTGGSFSEM